MDVQKLDNIAWSAAKSTAVAAFAGYLLGCPKQATQLALITSLGAAAIDQYYDKTNSNPRSRTLFASLTGCATIISASAVGQRLSLTTPLAIAAGLGVGHVWSKPDGAKGSSYPTLVYPMLGGLIGYLRPQLWTPAQGAVGFGLVASSWLARRSLINSRDDYYKKGGIDLKPALNAASLGLVLLTPWFARQLGQTIMWKQVLFAGLAMNATDALKPYYQQARKRYLG